MARKNHLHHHHFHLHQSQTDLALPAFHPHLWRSRRRLWRSRPFLVLLAAASALCYVHFAAAPRLQADCPAVSPLLVGPRLANLSAPLATLEKTSNRSALSLSPGGVYRPPDCRPRHRTAIVVPYRKRLTHLRALLDHLHPFLQRQQLHYGIYLVEQWGNGTFNKGRLYNAGAREALRDEKWSCIIFHDVDLLPEDDRNTYACNTGSPMHLSVAIDKFAYRLYYKGAFGGVVAVTPDQFRKMNGFSNQFWGWGQEDDNLWQRVFLAGMEPVRPPEAIARYKMIKHERDPGNERNPHNVELLKRTKLDWDSDGLNSVTHKLLSKERRRLYTHLMVDVGEKPHQEKGKQEKTTTSM
ncbi:beta-1,4-galactosyltransferase 3-like isoform X2 [Festucalex cinctus]